MPSLTKQGATRPTIRPSGQTHWFFRADQIRHFLQLCPASCLARQECGESRNRRIEGWCQTRLTNRFVLIGIPFHANSRAQRHVHCIAVAALGGKLETTYSNDALRRCDRAHQSFRICSATLGAAWCDYPACCLNAGASAADVIARQQASARMAPVQRRISHAR